LAAESAGLVYVNDGEHGLSRRRSGRGFAYRDATGEAVRDPETLQRIRKLAIPPAWTDVWICGDAKGHLQATGRDARGRKQYRYHAAFRDVRDSTKFEHVLDLARALPDIRKTVAAHRALPGLPREKVIATVVHLLETTLVRVGNDSYARENRSFGLTTLRNRHVDVEGAVLRFQFTGKGGKNWRVKLTDRRVAKVIRACQDLPGQQLFRYLDDGGALREITSSDVNGYLREVSRSDITEKDFRTWHGTVLAALALQEIGADRPAGSKQVVKEALSRVAGRLGNTPTICRKCYVHPDILQSHAEGQLALRIRPESSVARDPAKLTSEEKAVLGFLERRSQMTLKDRLRASATRHRAVRRRVKFKEVAAEKARAAA
jgi:DNA topoisomerase-1